MTEHIHISQKRKRSPSVVQGSISSTEGIHSPPSKNLKLDGSCVRTQSQAPIQTTPSGSISNGLSHLSPTSSGLPARRSLLDWDSFISIPKKTRRLSLQPQMQPHSANGPSTTDHFPHNSPVTARADPNDVKSSPMNPLRSPNNHHSHPSKEAKQTGAKSSGGPLTSAGSLSTQTKHPKAISGNVVNKDWRKLFDEMSPPDDEEKQGTGRKSFSSTEDNNSVIREALPGIVEDFSDLECGPYPEGTSQIWSSDRISSDSSPTTSIVLKPEMLLSKEKTTDSNERRKKVSQQRLIPKSQRGHSTQPVDVDVPPNVVICSAPNKIEESDEITPNVETEEQPIHMKRLSAAEDDVSPQTVGKWEVQSLESVKIPTTGIALPDLVATCSSENSLKQPPADQPFSSGSPCRPPPTSTSYRIESSPKKMDVWSSNEPIDQTETLNPVVSESDASLLGPTESCHPSVLDVLSCSGCDRVFAKPGYLKVHQVSCKKYHSKSKGHVVSDNLPLTPTVLKSEVHSLKEKLPDSDEGKRRVLEQQLIRKSQRRRSNRSADVDVPPNADICSALDGAVGGDKVTASNSEFSYHVCNGSVKN
ncbi:hypothetical protein FGIG_05123 [Fasciola gigantica]|uniref:C2H2-type domain-containing protein n=1 Tax=Fasciola gigantica TaxID=46835 RepID=A0A504Z7T1_FASGI|nr:hypothetical protein FGIG_05123 [Fasciola gigantica]